MSLKVPGKPETAPARASSALAHITNDARALRVSSPSLSYQHLQECQRARQERLFALNVAIEETRNAAYAAAVRLMGLTVPDHLVLAAYTELIDDQGASNGKPV